MRRPFLWPGIGLALGIFLGRISPLSNLPVFLFIIFLLPFLWVFRGRQFFLPLFLLAVMGAGILRIHQVLRIPPHHVLHFAQGDWVSLEGKVVSLPQLKEKGRRKIYSFILEAENLVRKGRFFETTGKAQVFLFNPSETASYGDRIRLRGKLALPRSPQNPGEFDYQNYLGEQGIHAVFEGYGLRSLRILGDPNAFRVSPLTVIQKLRDSCSRQIDSLFSLPVNALLKALVLGIRKDLPEGFRDDFIKTGTAHLVAISGMNITLVAGSLFFISLFLGLPQKGAACVGTLVTIIYVFISGAGIPVVRAGWMAVLFFTGLLLEREKDLTNSLFFALFMILAFDPKALFQVGFQLSFLSVLSLILFTTQPKWDWEGEWFQTVIVLVGTFPLLISYFSVFSWVSVLANALAIPLFHLGVLGGLAALLGGNAPLLGPLLTGFTSFALKAGLAWIHFWAEKSWGYFYLSPPSSKLVLFYYLALALTLLTRQFKMSRLPLARPIALSLWLMAGILFFIPPRNQSFALTVLAAGRNELLHIELPGGRHWLVNTGRGVPSNQARWILSPFLRRKGINHLEGILLTDFSRRHSGGLATLLANFSVGSLLFPSPSKIPPELSSYLTSRRLRQVTPLPLFPGDHVPLQEQAGFHVLKGNDESIALLIHYQQQKFLLLPSWKRDLLKQVLPSLHKLSFVDVLILPASGEPPDDLWKEILSQLLPHGVVFYKREPVTEPLLESLKREEIPFHFLSETGALRFEIQNEQLHTSPFHPLSVIDSA